MLAADGAAPKGDDEAKEKLDDGVVVVENAKDLDGPALPPPPPPPSSTLPSVGFADVAPPANEKDDDGALVDIGGIAVELDVVG